jgi:O-succinylbenzoic acid--CoA ligase
MINWHEHVTLPAMRTETHFDGRTLSCFADRPASFYAMFAQAVASAPEHEALSCNGERWTYAQVEREVTRIAAGLSMRGILAGERVLMLISNKPEFVFMLYALQKIGAIAVPVGTREQGPGLTYILNQCGAAGVVFDSELADRIPAADAVPALRLRITIGANPVAGAHALADLNGPAAPAVAVNEADCAVILYTSGTTGKPKGAMLTHFNIAHSVIHFEICLQLSAQDRAALAVPASHVTGLIALIATIVHVGGTLVILPEFKAADFVALAARERISYSLLVPAMYQLCLLQPAFREVDLSHWRIGGFGGAPMPAATVDTLRATVPGLTLVNCYGSTETTSPATIMPLGLTAAHNDSVGVAVPCATIKVVDANGQPVAAGESGELWIGGPMVVPGYWDNPDATANGFADGCWRSGDLGSLDAQGLVRIFDRIKDMINRGGFKIYSVEVENTIMGMAGVIEAAVVGQPCPVLGERVHAHVYAPNSALDAAAVRAYCATQLADYKVPEQIIFVDTPLPRNPNGKVLKRQLRTT